MVKTIATHTVEDPVEDVVATLNRDGAAIILNLVEPEFMDSLVAGLDFDDSTKLNNGFIGGQDNRSISAALHANPELCETLLLNERVLEMADRILLPEAPMAASSTPLPKLKLPFETSEDGCQQLKSFATYPENGPNCHHYRVGASVSLQARNGGAVQVLHREMAIYEPFVRHGPDTRKLIFNVMWAGSDFTAENGATRLVPGSHLWPAERLANESEVARAIMPKGSVLFWTCRTLHGLAASSSNVRRTGIFHSLLVNWLVQEENQYVLCPPEEAAKLSKRARQLLGYRSSINCGWVVGRDGDDLLAEGSSSPLDMSDQGDFMEGQGSYGAQHS